MTAKSNRGWVLLTSFLAGLVVGLFAGAYIYYAWVPADMVLRDAPPKTLAYSGQTVQYRDVYAAQAASAFQRLGSGPEGLQAARDLLGVTTGDASDTEALAMVQASAGLARAENAIDGNSGRYSQNDEYALNTLAEYLKASPPYPRDKVVQTGPQAARTQSKVVGFVILAVLAALAVLIMWLVDRRVGVQYLMMPGAKPGMMSHEPLAVSGDTSAPLPTVTGVMVGAASSSAPPSASTAATPIEPPVASPAALNPALAATAAGSAAVQARPGTAPLFRSPPCVYSHGDDRFDEDYAINGAMGELLGECGASIADRIGLDAPARVSALAVWVFDKNDFQSTTRVLMAPNAYNDPIIRGKLTARGQPMLASDNTRIDVETSTMRVEITVTGLQFNTDNNPRQGYFQKLTLSYVAWRR